MKKAMLVLVLLNMACASKPLSSQETSVKILSKSDASQNCQELEEVTAPGLASFSEKGRREDLKRATAKAGGNVVVIDRRDDNNTIYGVAYLCK